jgi:hypothetical protein
MNKICTKCRVPKDTSIFSKATREKDGLQDWCKSCRKKYNRDNAEVIGKWNEEYYRTHKDTLLHLGKIYNEVHREKRDKIRIEYIREIDSIHHRSNPAKRRAKNAKRRAKKLQQTPPWVSLEEFKQIEALYAECIRLTKETGIQHHVDHYYPLNSSKGSGLHCLANLRIITATENLTKGSKWPE